ncbi:MAG: flagellar biosynthetic protein FliR [Myxococcota bacterium]|jgi:flagellar biosynthetic protein FliR
MSEQIWLTLLLVFIRIAAFVQMMPVISARGVPKHVPVFLSVLLTMLVGPHAPLTEVPSAPSLILAAGGEVALGLAAGTILATLFSALTLASEIVSQQTGFAMMQLFNPVMKSNEGPLGILAGLLAGAMFLTSGMHLKFLMVLARSFNTIPPGTAGLSDDLARDVLAMGGEAIALGVQLAGPVVVLVLLINLFIGMLTRLAPKMNVFFSVGMSITGTTGILLFASTLPWMLITHQDTLDGGLRVVAHMFGLL